MAKIGRNDLCSCGSGKKYKRCCGDKKRRVDQAARVAPFRVRDARDKLLAHTITLETFEAVINNILDPSVPVGVCLECGCRDADCSQCVAAQGYPCSWVNEQHDLCSRCEVVKIARDRKRAEDAGAVLGMIGAISGIKV